MVTLELFDISNDRGYLTDLGGLCIAGTLHLVGSPLCESNAKQPQHVVVSGLHINMGLNQCLPFLDQGPKLVGRKIHTLKNKQNKLTTQTQ
jgi:hypothetical protein